MIDSADFVINPEMLREPTVFVATNATYVYQEGTSRLDINSQLAIKSQRADACGVSMCCT
jgi:hypothetical protein